MIMRAANDQHVDIEVEMDRIQPPRRNPDQLENEETTFDRKVMDVKTSALSSEASRDQEHDLEEPTDGGGNSTFPNYYSWARRNSQGVLHSCRLWYKKYVCHMILRRREIPRSHDGRHIDLDISKSTSLVDERTGKHYINNTIRSSRYTIWTFLPMQLWFQFTKIANFYFLIMGILQLIPGLSTTGTYTTILPLLFFLSFSIAREGYDDFRRYRLDRVENRRLARVLDGSHRRSTEREGIRSFGKVPRERLEKLKEIAGRYGVRNATEALQATSEISSCSEAKESSTTAASPAFDDSAPCSWATVKWIDLKVGDVIEIRRNEQVPADIVLLYADGRDGVAYVETMALDGETNLKFRRPPHQLAQRSETLTDLASCRAHFVVEDPNLDLYEFHGKVTVNGSTLPLTLENVVFRGSILRNTTRAIGLIVNTGEECKIRMNANKNPQTKAPAIQYMTNRVVILLTAFVILLSIGCTAGYEIWTPVFEDHAWYLANAHLPLDDIFIAFAIAFNNLIPLALYVSLEIIKFAQFLLLQDIEMYDPVSDTPMVSNTQTIYENLGQVSYIFSDKTGTLTENVMRFRKMSVAGTAWQHKDVRQVTIAKNLMIEDEKVEGTQGQQSVPTAVGTSELSDSPLFNEPSAALSIPRIQLRIDSPQDTNTDELLKYIQTHPASAFASKAKIFLLALALCHTCFPEVRADEKIGFQATSPDELALVEAAQDLSFLLIDRSTKSITLLTHPSGAESEVRKTYEILDIIEFSTKRKRMSIIVRFPDGRICLLCKGADSVVLPRLKLSSKAPRDASRFGVRNVPCMDELNVARLRRSMQDDSMSSLDRLGLGLNLSEVRRKSASFIRPGMGLEADRYFPGIGSTRLCGTTRETSQTFARASREYPLLSAKTRISGHRNDAQSVIDEAQSLDDGAILQRCHQQINEFACEGLRTLVYGYRFIDEMEYDSWHRTYHKATTSLVERQEMIEAAGELIEQNLDLAGATAIEDKLQKGVPETIDKLHRANIKIWMLTGDKRETAINIAHSARICKPYSQVVVLDYVDGDIEQQIASILSLSSMAKHLSKSRRRIPYPQYSTRSSSVSIQLFAVEPLLLKRHPWSRRSATKSPNQSP
jgi:phospholipid-translocating ATPase